MFDTRGSAQSALLLLGGACASGEGKVDDDDDSPLSGGRPGNGDGDGVGGESPTDGGSAGDGDGGDGDGAGAQGGGSGGSNGAGGSESAGGATGSGSTAGSGGEQNPGGSGGEESSGGGDGSGGSMPAECSLNVDCSSEKPTCAQGRCVECESANECASEACSLDGICVAGEESIYAHSEDGSTDANCGSLDNPCLSVATAAAKLNADKPNLVLIPGSQGFEEEDGILLSGEGLQFHGNNVLLYPVADSVISTEGSATLMGLKSGGCYGPARIVVECLGSSLKLVDSHLFQEGRDLVADECAVEVESSFFEILGQSAVSSTCTTCDEASLRITRSHFYQIANAVYTEVPGSQLVNNVFDQLAHNTVDYGIQLEGDDSLFAFNTVYGSGSCQNQGVISCLGSNIVATRTSASGTSGKSMSVMSRPTLSATMPGEATSFAMPSRNLTGQVRAIRWAIPC